MSDYGDSDYAEDQSMGSDEDFASQGGFEYSDGEGEASSPLAKGSKVGVGSGAGRGRERPTRALISCRQRRRHWRRWSQRA